MKEYFKKVSKKLYFKPFVFFILICILVPLGFTLTRFIMHKIRDHYLESKNFYFNSNRLKKNNPTYKINNWNGVGEFAIEITVNTKKNNLLASDFDVTYELEYTCSSDVICESDKTNGTIYQSTNTDIFTVIVTPNRVFNDGESTIVSVSATSTSPYVEKISANFEIEVGKRGVSYFIDDEANRPYLMVSMTNALTHYTVKEAFNSYNVGDQIDSMVYKNLSNTNKAKCVSTYVTLEFDPNDILLDITSSIFKKCVVETQNIGGVPYVKKITFPMDAMSSEEVRFYKINHTLDYTYPFENATSVVTFSAE